jgi:hypothetical protein
VYLLRSVKQTFKMLLPYPTIKYISSLVTAMHGIHPEFLISRNLDQKGENSCKE